MLPVRGTPDKENEMIELNGLGMRYPGGTEALRPTCLKFHKGHFTVLLGRSGAGKSTLLRCLNFLNKPTCGEIVVEGLGSLDSDRKKLRQFRRLTGMIFQQHQLIPRQSALKNVLVGRVGAYSSLRSLFPLPRHEQEFALECLERVGLLNRALERVENLSGGEQQRVGIARALAQKPQLILADEPVASLDPGTADGVLALLHKITKEDHIPAIVSLHQVEWAKKYADRIIGLAEGTVVYDGIPEGLTPDVLQLIYHRKRVKAAPMAA
jgi:phosphonate transport system ATP-binding protein